MPAPSVRRPARRAGPAVAAGLLVIALSSVGCSGPGEARPSVPPVATTVGTPAPTGSDPSEVAAALDDLLTARDAAIAAGDAEAFEATVADPASPGGARQLASFGAAVALGAVRVRHGVTPPVDDTAAVPVALRYRVAGIDGADRTATVRYALAPRGSGWAVAAEEPSGTDAAPPWLAMPGLTVRRSEHAVVAGTAGAGALAAAARTVDRSLPSLEGLWSGTPRRTLVLVPETPGEADALLGTPGGSVGEVGARTDGPVGADGLATGDRVVLDPQARQRLTPTGRDVVLTHELAHVAVRASVPGSAPTWLAEGYADHVGYARADLPQARLVAPLAAAVAAGTAPTELPSAATLDPAVTDIEVAYLAAWQAAELVVDLRGESGLRALVRACAGVDGPEAAERACAAAMPDVLGVDRAGFTRLWRARLDALAG